MTPSTRAASAAPTGGLTGDGPVVDALLRVTATALAAPVRLTVARADDIAAMLSAQSAATAQLGMLAQRVLLAGDRLLLSDIPRTTDRAADSHGPRGFAGWPLLGPDSDILGVLVATTDGPDSLCERDLAVLADAASAVAAALAADQELAETAALADGYRKMIDQSPTIIGRCTLDGDPTFVSAATTRVLGYDPTELLGNGHLIEPHPDDAQNMREDWQTVTGGEATLRNARLRHRDGSWRTVRLSTGPVRDADGEIYEIRFSARDVTEDVARETELAAIRAEAASRQATLDTVLETIEIGVMACDANGDPVLANRAARDLASQAAATRDTAVWTDWAAFEPDGITPTTIRRAPLMLALEGEEVAGVVIAVPMRDGGTTLTRCHARQLRDESGSVTGAVVVFADITALAITSEALMEARDRAESIIATVTDGFMSLDEDGVVREWNPAAEQITGWSADDVVGRRMADFLAPREMRTRVQAMFTGDARARNEMGIGLTRQMQHKDGRSIMVEMSNWRTVHRGEGRINAFVRDVTKSRAAAEAIAAAHAQFTAALDAMPRSVTLANVVRDADGEPSAITFRWSNKHSLQLFGRELAELEGLSLTGMCSWLNQPDWYDKFVEVARTGAPLSATTVEQDGDSTVCAFDLVVTPLNAETLLIEAADITERVRAKTALERSERMLSVSNHAAGMGSVAVDLRTGVGTWSRQTYELFGLNPDTDDLPNADTFRTEIVHPDDRASFEQTWKDITSGAPHPCEFRVVRPDGELRHILAWPDVTHDAEGNVVSVIFGVQDQTERRNREIALAQSRELEGLVVDRSPIGVAFLDEDGRYLRVNAALCHMLGRTTDELVSANFLDITHPAERAAGLRRHRDLVEGTVDNVAQDKRYLHSNGRALWVSVHKTVLQSSGPDQPIRVLSQIIDISERKEQTEELTRQARTDALTGLANRRSWEPRLNAALADSHATGKKLAVAILDLDKFKTFNDTFGHPVGDQLLSETSHAWRAYLIRKAPSALLARLGGEEFGVLLPNTDLDKARGVLEALIHHVARDQTASAGLTVAHPDDDPKSLMTRADGALYAAKGAGRARVEIELR